MSSRGGSPLAKTFQSTICDQPSIEILANFYEENTTHKYVVSNIFLWVECDIYCQVIHPASHDISPLPAILDSAHYKMIIRFPDPWLWWSLNSLLSSEWGDENFKGGQLQKMCCKLQQVTADNGIFRVCKVICMREIKDVISKGISDNARSVLNWLICWLTWLWLCWHLLIPIGWYVFCILKELAGSSIPADVERRSRSNSNSHINQRIPFSEQLL